MDILDVHIVRINHLAEEPAFDPGNKYAIDNDAYLDGYPKYRDEQALINHIVSTTISTLFSTRMHIEKNIRLMADTPYSIVFAVPFTTDYVIVPSYVHSKTNTGLNITNETATGFDITSNGDDCTLDIVVIPITPLT
jgi:hypothetical protein